MHLPSPQILPHRRDSVAELRQHGEWAAGCKLGELPKLRSRTAKVQPVAPLRPRMDGKVKANHRTCALEDTFAAVAAQLYGILDAQAQRCTGHYSFPIPTALPLKERPSQSEAAEIMKQVPQQVGANKIGVQLRFVLQRLWTDAIPSPDFRISQTERYGPAELDIVASRDLEPGEVVDGLRGYNLKLCGPEETVPDGFNELLTFQDDDTANVSIGLGPLRILNHSCDPNSEWVQEVVSGKTTLWWSVRTIRSITTGESLLVRYNDDIFGTGNWRCKCGATHLHGPPIREVDDEKGQPQQAIRPTSIVTAIEPAAAPQGVTPVLPPSPAPTEALHGKVTAGLETPFGGARSRTQSPDSDLADWQDQRSSTPFHPVIVPTLLTLRSPTPPSFRVDRVLELSPASTSTTGPRLDERLTPTSTTPRHLAATCSSKPVASSSSSPVAYSSLTPQSDSTRLYRRLVIDLTRDDDDDDHHRIFRPRRGQGLIIDLTDDEPHDMPGSSMTIIDLTGDDFEDDEISLEVELLRGSDLDDLAAVIEDHANDPEVGSLFDSDLDELECDADDAESLEWTPTENLRSPSRTDDRAYDWLDPLVPGGHSDFWSRHPASRAGQSLSVPSGPRNDVTNLSDDLRQLSMCDPWVKRQWQGRTVYDLSEEPQLYDDLGDGFAPAKRRKL